MDWGHRVKVCKRTFWVSECAFAFLKTQSTLAPHPPFWVHLASKWLAKEHFLFSRNLSFSDSLICLNNNQTIEKSDNWVATK